MKVKEFLSKICTIKNNEVHLDPDMLDSEMVVVTSESGIGGTPSTPVISAFNGFDWDHGKMLLRTKDKIVRMPSKKGAGQSD